LNIFFETAKNNPMSNHQSVTHYRDNRGRIVAVEPVRHEKRSSGLSRFLGGVVASLVFGLALSGILLYTAMQTNAENYAKIDQIERQSMQKDAEIRQIKAQLERQSGEIKTDKKPETQRAELVE